MCNKIHNAHVHVHTHQIYTIHVHNMYNKIHNSHVHVHTHQIYTIHVHNMYNKIHNAHVHVHTHTTTTLIYMYMHIVHMRAMQNYIHAHLCMITCTCMNDYMYMYA